MRIYSIAFIVVMLTLLACARQDEQLTKAELQFAVDSIIHSSDLAATPRISPRPSDRNCAVLCNPDEPNYLCLTAGTLASDRDQQISAFATVLMKPQPVNLSHHDLLKIFQLQGAGYDKARGDTTVIDNVLQNAGQWSTISAKTTGGLAISMLVPTSVQYSFSGQANGFRLNEMDPSTSFSIAFNDAILQQTYGGRVSTIEFHPSLVIFTTTNGCVSYNPSPALANGKIATLFKIVKDRRLRAERVCRATERRLQAVSKAYDKVGLFTDDSCNPEAKGGCGGCASGKANCITSMGTLSCVDYDWCQANGTPECSN